MSDRMAMTINRPRWFFESANTVQRRRWSFPVLVLLVALCAGCAATRPDQGGNGAIPSGERSAEETWGIAPLHMRLTANGTMLDFRYRVNDPDKAAPLFRREVKPYVRDEATGLVYVVPDMPKVGAVRSTTRNPAAGQEHFILFGNPSRALKAGSRVTVVIGDYKVMNLVVE